VPCWWCSGGGKSVYALHSWMGELDYAIEPEVECPDNDPNNVASGRLLLLRVMMLSNSIQHVRFFHRLPISALRACLYGRLSFRWWRLPCHYLLWGPLLQSTPIVFWRRSRWILKRCWELWTERIRHPQGGEDS
jgi:hypothetical protein